MLKLVQGVVSFHVNVLPGLADQFAWLAENGQDPDTLMVACSDSRVVPNLFASTDPGDLLVVRNPGGLIPPFKLEIVESVTGAESAALELALEDLRVKDIIVCGHSNCAVARKIWNADAVSPGLERWMRHGAEARQRFLAGDTGVDFDSLLSPQDRLSQLMVLLQIEHLRTYPRVSDSVLSGALRLHPWWFHIATGSVHAFEPDEKKFTIIDQEHGARILQRLQ